MFRNKYGHFIIRPVHLEDIQVLNIYVPNNRPCKYIKQYLIGLLGEIEKCTVTVGD